ncbi:Cystatin domain [Dillenia turbinata]|uniref:Cystatin domain n=1 Tax=Dillenia turbinata TaxID=194707 RepID=A0AAN8UW85_9MAGN
MVKVEILALVLVSLVLVDGTSALFGGFQPIKNLEDPHIIEIAEFAVKEMSKNIQTRILKLKSIDQGRYQVVAGTTYQLHISTTNIPDVGSTKYEVVVFEKLGSHDKRLVSYKPINA